MKRAWIVLFPLLFLPNSGFVQRTQYGAIELADWLILPFIVALLGAPGARSTQQVSQVKLLFLVLLGWILVSILSIHFRYDYRNALPVVTVCLLKLGKLAAYTGAGVLIPSRLTDAGARSAWAWGLIAALLAVGAGLLTSSPVGGAESSLREAYKSYNVVIVLMSLLCCHIASLWIDGHGAVPWRVCAAIALVLALLSIIFSASESSHGRGGWLALALGLTYLWMKRSRHLKSVAVILLCVAIACSGYLLVPNFRHLVDATISPPSDETTFGINDGARFETWAHEAPKWINAPVLGTGLYHRGGLSGLWTSGSHNFFIQMLLETGLAGALIIVTLFVQLWRSAGSALARRSRLTTATRSALVAGTVAGISGEYFYAGIVALAFMATNAAVLSLPSEGVAQRRSIPHRVQPAPVRS